MGLPPHDVDGGQDRYTGKDECLLVFQRHIDGRLLVSYGAVRVNTARQDKGICIFLPSRGYPGGKPGALRGCSLGLGHHMSGDFLLNMRNRYYSLQ